MHPYQVLSDKISLSTLSGDITPAFVSRSSPKLQVESSNYQSDNVWRFGPCKTSIWLHTPSIFTQNVWFTMIILIAFYLISVHSLLQCFSISVIIHCVHTSVAAITQNILKRGSQWKALYLSSVHSLCPCVCHGIIVNCAYASTAAIQSKYNSEEEPMSRAIPQQCP